ncbi:MAG TPA: amidohydrolase family protein [Polyangiaceae bacterium]
MLIDRIASARLQGHEELQTLELAEGRVRRVVRAAAEAATGDRNARTLEANGRVLVASFVDAHVHLDKAFLLGLAGPTEASLGSAIARVAELRSLVSSRHVAENAGRAAALLIKNGVTAARAHVEIDPLVGLSLLDLHGELQNELRSRLQLQLVAFPQRGFDVPGVRDLMSEAVRRVEVVGGCPYVDADPARHLDLVFGWAEQRGLPIDLHLDFSDDPQRSLLKLVTERTLAHGMQGKVTIGHVTTLACMSPAAQQAALESLALADIALVVLPATDLYLGGHGEPGLRSLAPLERARAAGVRVAIGNNNIQNPFAPFGNGNLLQAAWLSGLLRRMNGPSTAELLLDAISHGPAAILGLPAHGPAVGARADLALLDLTQSESIVSSAPSVLATLRAAHLSHVISAPGIA